MTSRYLELQPDNRPASGVVSYKNGFPVLSFTIQAQNGMLDPRSIRLVGDLNVYKDNAVQPATAKVLPTDANKVTMDNRLGIFACWDHLIIRNGRSKMICEDIRNYNSYMSAYLAATSGIQDLMGHLGETCLVMPNRDAFHKSVVERNEQDSVEKSSFSCHLPSGFMSGGNSINLMPSAFGAVEIEIHLAPDSNVLFTQNGVVTGIQDAHYTLTDVKLCCEVSDIPSDQLAEMSQQTSGSMEFNTITSLYTSINSANAQLQYNLALKQVQSCFLTFCPSSHINTLAQNGLALTYPAVTNAAGALASFTRVQWLKGGSKYPMDFDIVPNINNANATLTTVADPQLLKEFLQSIIPEYQLDRTSVSPQNFARTYDLLNDGGANSYTKMPDGGAVFGLGVRYSQFNSGQDFSAEQWGVSLDSTLTSDNPISVFLFFKAKATLLWSGSGVQLIQ